MRYAIQCTSKVGSSTHIDFDSKLQDSMFETPLQTIERNLGHLTWETQMIAHENVEKKGVKT